jgi:hypothetical protein
VCAEATASFSVLSESINQARSLLHQKCEQSETIVALICRLQSAEKDKLNYTAALHYEQIRSQAHQLAVETSARTDDGGTTISSMLLEDVRSLKHKIAASVNEVNEVLEELRFAMIDNESD